MAMTYRFDEPDRFVVGAIGEAEDRSFCLQVREGRRLFTMGCEEHQVAALAQHLGRVLDEVSRLSHGTVDIPHEPVSPDDLDPLDLPLIQDFSIGTMAIGWDEPASAVRLDLYSESGGDPVQPDDSLSGEELAEREAERAAEMVSICVRPEVGREFVARAKAVLRGGRPVCPFCAQAIEPTGHVCPRANGYVGPDEWASLGPGIV